RNSLGSLEDLRPELVGKAGNETGEELFHGVRGKRLEEDGGEVAGRGAPARSALLKLGAGESHDEEWGGPRPLEEVLDEVEQRRVRPLHVLEDHDRGVDVRQPLDEKAPGREQVLSLEASLLEPEQVLQPRLDKATLLGV